VFLAREVVWREISGTRFLRGHVAGGRETLVSGILTSFLSTIDSIKNYSDNSLYLSLFPFVFKQTTKTWLVTQTTKGKQPPLKKKLKNSTNGMYSINFTELVPDTHFKPVRTASYAHLNLHNNNHALHKHKCLQTSRCVNTRACAANHKPQTTR
jgi:hypothetical protein